MLRHICVAYDDDQPARWGLAVAADLARRASARMTIAHVAPPVYEALDEGEEIGIELLGAREDVYRRQRLRGIAATLAPDVEADVRVLSGGVPDQLLRLLQEERPDLVVAGTRSLRGAKRLLAPRVGPALVARAPCPVMLVHGPPHEDVEDAFLVIAAERWHGLRRRLGRSRSARLAESAPCPVVIVPPGRRRLPIVGSMVRSRSSLLWQLFAVNALVLVGATLALVVAPVSVSRSVVLTEVLVLGAGLAVMLALNLALLERTLAPLRLLTEVMGAIDPRRPGRRLALTKMRAIEVRALADAFNAMLDRLENEGRRSSLRALAAQEDERLRIAREMHDQVGQTLTALTLQAERAARLDEPVDHRLLDQIARTALQSLDDVRRIGRELRPEALDDLGLGNALISLCRRLATQGGVRIVPTLEPGIPALRAEVDLVVYRIAQEAITNALRHAGAERIDLELSGSDSVVELRVRDDGGGMPADIADDTAGISGMRERALLVGGDLRFRSRSGEGTEVRLSVPVEEAAG